MGQILGEGLGKAWGRPGEGLGTHPATQRRPGGAWGDLDQTDLPARSEDVDDVVRNSRHSDGKQSVGSGPKSWGSGPWDSGHWGCWPWAMGFCGFWAVLGKAVPGVLRVVKGWGRGSGDPDRIIWGPFLGFGPLLKSRSPLKVDRIWGLPPIYLGSAQ